MTDCLPQQNHILRRAANVLNSNGQPVDGLTAEPAKFPSKRSNKLGASIRRKFNNMVWTRSPSTSPSAQHGEFDIKKPSLMHAHTADETADTKHERDAVTPHLEVTVPLVLQKGTPMVKVSSKKRRQVVFRLDPDQGRIVWEGKVHRYIPIEAIKEIRSGSDARYYRQQFQLAPQCEERWLTIIYILDGDYKTLHVVVPTKDVFDMWNYTLRSLHAVRQKLMNGLGYVEMRQAMWDKHYWKGADEEHDQKLEFEEVEKLCKRLQINSGQDDLYRLFKQADTSNRNYLDFDDWRLFVKLLKARPELDRLYNQLCKINGGTFDFEAFESFMKEKQHCTHTREELLAVFDKYATTEPTSPALGEEKTAEVPTDPCPKLIMSRKAFTNFLMSSDNPALPDHDRRIHHDMTRPLSEYYISSSHNTYLVGHQLVGTSTIEGYIRALLHSCRSVEVDVYDGDDGPVVYHGKTLTTKVSLREVCEAIMKYGFVASPYPIIISAEVHCRLEQQDMIADIMLDVFGDALVQKRPDKPIRVLPSPEELKGKILLKTKNLNISSNEAADGGLFIDTSASSTDDSEDDWRNPKRRQSDAIMMEYSQEFQPKPTFMERVRSIRMSSSKAARSPRTGRPVSHSRSPSGTSTVTLPPSPTAFFPSSSPVMITTPFEAMLKVKMSQKLLDLLVYTVGVKCRGLNKKEEYAPEHIFSLSESTVNKYLKESSTVMDLIKHTRDHLVRIYPKGMRVNSTNYEPHRCWYAGVQLVALNWQTFDLGYMINQAMFQRNGRSGYILKPMALRAQNKDVLMKRTKHRLEVTIISAQQLPRPKDATGREVIEKGSVDPYVEVSVHVPDWTMPTLEQRRPPRTNMVKNNGFNPVWEERLSIPFECVGDMKELVFVRFAVKQGGQEDGEPLAVFCASLGSLQLGYRHLPLHDAQMSQYLFSTLFVRIGVLDVA
ncbi:PLC-like phosphodiesterase [Guyanagaster necrorhizus]|uniref:Phosphoinositide phospholipase C n=1 Tax=Guyanagaster necrorhizus TaxID=856835 RepID=A0A9P7VWC2_9AGAR|nr:PLC-like phosphodiesterase [Guyanagaster necrorhizus MCA 3950]KAG7447803.1 PLC-like phosphodiesterase [Guyanagaster necrorhizus MCA 3950]